MLTHRIVAMDLPVSKHLHLLSLPENILFHEQEAEEGMFESFILRSHTWYLRCLPSASCYFGGHEYSSELVKQFLLAWKLLPPGGKREISKE